MRATFLALVCALALATTTPTRTTNAAAVLREDAELPPTSSSAASSSPSPSPIDIQSDPSPNDIQSDPSPNDIQSDPSPNDIHTDPSPVAVGGEHALATNPEIATRRTDIVNRLLESLVGSRRDIRRLEQQISRSLAATVTFLIVYVIQRVFLAPWSCIRYPHIAAMYTVLSFLLGARCCNPVEDRCASAFRIRNDHHDFTEDEVLFTMLAGGVIGGSLPLATRAWTTCSPSTEDFALCTAAAFLLTRKYANTATYSIHRLLNPDTFHPDHQHDGGGVASQQDTLQELDSGVSMETSSQSLEDKKNQ